MGAADVVPGVSGGTIAFITGIYEELLDSIKSIDVTAILLLKSFKLAELWRHINGNFLLILVAGILTAVLSLAKILHYLMEVHPIQLWSFFFGLVLISAIWVFKAIKNWNVIVIVFAIIGIAVAWLLTSASPASIPDNHLFTLLSGAIAICAMILPGISGSFILLILGKYQFIITALKELDILVILVFALGCVAGLLSFARVVSWALKKYHDITVAMLSGFMLGSLNKIWPWKETISFRTNSKGEQVPFLQENVMPTEFFEKTGQQPYWLEALFFAALGILLVIVIEKAANYRKEPV